MTKEKYYLPTHATGQFHCPHCGVYAKQRWAHLSAVSDAYTRHYQNGTLSYSSNILGLAITSFNLVEDWTVSICEHCYGMVIWFDKKIIYPKKITVSAPNEDLNDDIKNLVKKGLNPKIQQSLDILRITGNNAVHPGEINLEEEPEKVLKLFELINFITEKMITELKEINNFYDTLPENSKKAVEKRDNK